jgi:molecular chaperone DnaK
LDELTEIKDMPLPKSGENKIRMTIFDNVGRSSPETITELVIFRTDASAAGMPTTHNLAVKTQRNTLTTLVKKGTLLPTSGMDRFRAARDFRAGDGSYLEFEVYEQADGVDDPAVNLPIGIVPHSIE